MFKFIILVCFFAPTILVFAQNNDAELVYQETNISLKAGKLYKDISYEIKIYNRAGQRFNKVSINYSKMTHISKIEGYIKDSNGKFVRKLKKNEISTRNAISSYFYEDNFVKEFTLKHNTYPYSIVYSYQEVQDEFLYIDYYSPIINTHVPTKKAVLTLDIPKNYKVRFDTLLIDEFKKMLSSTRTKYRWEIAYQRKVNSEIFSPPLLSILPKVIIVPEAFKFDIKGSFKNWIGYGNWQYEVNQGLSYLPKSEQLKIQSLIKGIDNQKEKIRVLYHYLQDNTRYINVSIETGGMKPYPAAYVAKNKYGDCKALTNYFKSILKFIDIPSYYTNVYAGDAIHKINKNFPSQQFNHVFLSVPIKNDTLWLDCTSNAAFNYVGTFIQNRSVLIVNKDRSHFTKTPALSKKEVLEIRDVKFTLNEENDVFASFKNSYRGDKYESLFYISKRVSQSKKTTIISDYFVEKGFELNEFNLINSARDSAKINLTYTAKSTILYKKYGNEVLITLLPFSIPRFEKPEDRQFPVQLDYPIYKIDSLEYTLPKGYELSNSMKSQTISSKYGEYKIDFEINLDKLKIIKSFLLNSGNYSNEEYDNFYTFVNKVQQIEAAFHIVTNKK